MQATKPLLSAADYFAGPAHAATGALTEAANKSIRENTALVFGVTAVTCLALGYFWNKLVPWEPEISHVRLKI